MAAYAATSKFPRDEKFGLISQIRRAAASIPANIAEGCGKDSNPDYHRFLQTASGSASELEYHFLLAHELHLVTSDEYKKLDGTIKEVRRMLAALIRHVAASPTGQSND
ncbi:MAG: four helix bundle protein [Terriglobales bacterium]